MKQSDRSQDLREYVNSQIAVRLFEERDAEQIAQLFHDTVREINIRDYSSNQVRAWAPDNIYFRDWVKVCSSRFTYIAHIMDTIVGFGELEANGHIDCFYCHKNYQGCGVGKQIYRALETKAVELSLNRLFVEVSITAKPFFQRMGFSVVQKQEVTCRGESFVNYVMEKFL
jgi:putative acetyltransferase